MPDLAPIFAQHYATDWQGCSGPGSKPENAWPYLDWLKRFAVRQPYVTRWVDVGCGDLGIYHGKPLNWFHVPSNYTAIDLVDVTPPGAKRMINFVQGDVREIKPEADIAIVKDVIQHLSHKTALELIEALKGCKTLVLVNDWDNRAPMNNIGIQDGQWSMIDPASAPFNLPGNCEIVYRSVPFYKMVYVVTR
jgi:hypothetical protein